VKTLRLLVLGLFTVVMVSGASALLVDDFEDGNVQGWTGDTSKFSANSNNPIEGNFDGELTSQGEANRVEKSVAVTSKDFYFKQVPGAATDQQGVTLESSSGSRIGIFRFRDNNDIAFFNGQFQKAGTFTSGELYIFEFEMDYSNNQLTMFINGTNSGTFSFDNPASDIGSVEIYNSQTGSIFTDGIHITDSNPFNSPPQFSSTSVAPDPPLIGQTADFSYTASDPDGSISSVDLTLKDDGTTVFTGSKSTASATFNPPDTLTKGDITATFTATDNKGATTTTTLTRTLTDTDPQLSLTGTSGKQFTKAASYTVDTTATDNVPNEQLTCTLSSGYTTFDQRTVTEGDQYTVQPSLRVGTTDTNVTCVENDGNQTTSQTLTTTVKALEFQSVQADNQEAIEKTGQDYFATFKHADFASETSLELNYDGNVEDTVTRQLSGVSTETVSATAETPLVSDANKSFNFDFTADVTFTNRTGGTDTTTITSSSKNQRVFRKILTDCTNAVKGVTGPQAQKIVLKNETEQSTRVTGDIEYNYDVSTQGSSHTRNYAFTETSTETATTCLYPDFAEYDISGPVSYEASGFGKRVFQVQNTTITNSSTTLPLFLLPDTDSTDTVIRVETPSGAAIDGTVKVLRFDVGTNTFTQAAKLTTGSDGETEVGLEDGAFYEFVVQNKDGDVIFTRDQEQFTPQTVPATVTLTVGQELPDFVENQDGFTFKLEEIKNNGNITGLEATVNHDTSALQNATLKVDKNAVIGENTICRKTVQTSASTLFCDFNETAEGNQFSFVLSSFVQGDRFVLQTGSIDKTKGLFGINQVFAGFLVFMSLSAFGFVTPRLTVMFSTAGVIAAYTLGLISVGVGAMASLVAVALIVTFAGERTV